MALVSRSNPTIRSPYHVFLSFRGEDTRKIFIDYLYTALVGAGFRTFLDDNELQRGEAINQGLQRAIQQSRCSVIVFSKNYASSTWCLDELLMILERRRTSSDQPHVILPVFYEVDPSQVRKQTCSYRQAFATHQKTQPLHKVKEWRAALTQVANLAGIVCQPNGYHSKFIKAIVKEIGNKLSCAPLSVGYLIGIDDRVNDINLWIKDGSVDVGILVVYGMSGVGKTTIAKHVYNSNFRRFEGSSFIENIRANSEQINGLVQIQKQLLYDLTGRKVRIQNVSEGQVKIEDAISSKRVILVLDDVDHMDQFDALLTMKDLFCQGSKIILTTRRARLLKAHGVTRVHNVEIMDYNESLKLFSWHAFQQDSPKDGYMEISKKFVEHCGGLPLALQVLGSSLLGQCVAVWRSALLKLEAIPNSEIMNKLRISYDSLIDNHDQELFLHIACFFIGRDRDYIVQVLDGCDFYTTVGIVNLIDRCLVTIDRETKVQMHDMIRDMGRGIVRLASEEPGKRSRLWHHKDSFRVLREKNGTQTIEGLAFQMYMDTAKPPINSSERHFDTSAFSGMKKLRLLHLSHVQLDGCYGDFPQDLKWLCWVAFPLDSIPIDFSLEKLVVLEMQYSSLKQIYKGTKYLPSLRVLDLSHSDDITGATDFSLCPNLEKLILEGCANLFSIHESIGNVKRLIYLNMKDCKDLWMLPETILKLQLLETLVISGCTSLGVSSMEMMRSMESLKELEMDEIPISHVQSKGGMVKPWPGRSSSIWSFLPSSLVSLSLSGCNLSDDAFSMGFPDLSSLRRLNLGDNPISTLPSCFKGLTMLDELDFSYCSSLISLEELPEVEELIILIGCTALEIITFQSTWRACIRLDLGGQPNLVEWQYQYKLEPIGKVDMAIINLLELGNLDLESLPAIWLRHPTNPTYQLYPIQGLHEEGVFSTFLPGNDVPGEFFHRIRKGSSSVSFTLPLLPNINIRGLNIFIVYTASDKNSPRVPRQIITKVRNKSKALKWIYGPSFHAIPDEGEDMTLLSHWSMLESQFESGDEVVVSVCERRPDLFNIKEFGVQVVQQEKEEDMTSLPLTHPDFGKSLEPKIELYDPNRENYSDCHFEDSDEDTDNGEQLDGYHTIPAATSADGSDCMPGFRKWKMLVIAAVGLFGRCFITFPGSKRWDTTIHPSLE